VTVADKRTLNGNEGSPRVPDLLASAAAWAWRLIVVGALIYLVMMIIDRISVVVIPIALALLLCSLLHPLVDRLRHAGMPSLAATWVAILLAIGLLVGMGVLVGVRANAEFPKLLSELRQTARQTQDWLIHGPLHLQKTQLETEVDKGLKYLQARQSELVGTALGATAAVAEFIAGMVLMLFVTFFLLKDGRTIWNWLISGTGQARDRIERAGLASWQTLSHYVQGTVMVSAVHAIAVAITLVIMGVPLVAPLAVLVFFASFIPLVGILFAGGIALLVVLSAKGAVMGLIFLGILIFEQQVEGHLLQPLVVGRRLHFHPLGIIVVLSVGGVVGGIPGAALAVPITAIIYRAWPELRSPGPAHGTTAHPPQTPSAAEPAPPTPSTPAAPETVPTAPGAAASAPKPAEPNPAEPANNSS
jgi:predicted PurR-regulated permease PerM